MGTAKTMLALLMFLSFGWASEHASFSLEWWLGCVGAALVLGARDALVKAEK